MDIIQMWPHRLALLAGAMGGLGRLELPEKKKIMNYPLKIGFRILDFILLSCQ